MTGDYIYFKTTPMLRACSVCNRLTRTVAEVELGGYIFLFCCKQHAQEGIENFQKNKSLAGISETPMTDYSSAEQDIRSTSNEDNI